MKLYEIPFPKMMSYCMPFNGFIVFNNGNYIYKKLSLINSGEYYNTYVISKTILNILDDLSKWGVDIIILINGVPLDYFVFKQQIKNNSITINPQYLNKNIVTFFKSEYYIINMPKMIQNENNTNITIKNRDIKTIFNAEKNNINTIVKYFEEKQIFPIETFISDKNLPISISKELRENRLTNLIIRTMPDIIILDNEENIRMYEIKRKYKIRGKKIILKLELVQYLFNYIYTKNNLEVNYILTNENNTINLNAVEISKFINKVVIHPLHTKIIHLFNTCLMFCEHFNVDYEIREFPINQNISGDPYIILEIPH
jgi:hypothetical protein